MKHILYILLIVPMISFASDSLFCEEMFQFDGGTYAGTDKNGIGTFIRLEGQKVLFSFNKCVVTLG